MARFRRADLTGGWDMALKTDAAAPALLVKAYYPQPVELTVQPRVQQHHGYESGGHSHRAGTSTLPPVTIRVDTLATDQRAVQKQAVLGRSPLFVGESTIPLPRVELCRDSVFALEITARPLSASAALSGAYGCHADHEPHFRIGVSGRQLAAHRQDGWTAFWLLTRSQAERRLMAVAHDQGLFDRDDDESSDTLTKLTFAIYSGLDSPVLTERLPPNSERNGHV
ncbi:MAG: hypothetical protein SFV23_16870 [Planctomycetaceae bacterium]|nr:hypothetical protein [Planctomycetaceae bacterium]